MRLLYVLFAVLIPAVSLRAQSYQPNLTLSSNSPACDGQSFQINAGRSIPPGGTTTSFFWSGPNSFTSNSFASLTVPASTASAGVYSVTMTFSGANNGTATASTTVALGTPKPEALAKYGGFYSTYGTAICAPASLSLLAYPDAGHSSNAATFRWTGPNGYSSTEQSPVVAQAIAGNYVVEATYPNGCGTGKDTIAVRDYAPVISINSYLTGTGRQSTTNFCTGSTAELQTSTEIPPAGTSLAYRWSGPNGFTSTAQNFTLTNLTTAMTGLYSVTVTFSGACSITATAARSLQVGPPSVSAYSEVIGGTGGYQYNTACPGSTIGVYASPANAFAYQWTGPNGFTSTAQSFTLPNATAAMSGLYSVTVTVSEGCSNVAVADLTVGTPGLFINVSTPGPTPSYTSSFCPGASARLFVSVNNGTTATYRWSGPNGFTSTASSLTLTNLTTAMAGTYSVTATFTGACAGVILTKTQTIQVGSPVVYAGSGNLGSNTTQGSNTFCPGSAFRVEAFPTGTGISYRWSGPNSFTSTAQSFTLTNALPAMSGAYSLTVTFPEGCTSAAVANVTIGTPTVYATSRTAGPNPINTSTFCLGSAFEVSAATSASATVAYRWSGPNGFTSTAQTFTLTSATAAMTGMYSVTATFSGACSGQTMASIYIRVGVNTAVVTTPRTLVNPNDPVLLTASGCDSYTERVIWSTGSDGRTLLVTPSQSTTYSAVCRLIYGGCDGPASNGIAITVTNAPPVNLRLSMQLSTRTPEINKPVGVTVLIENQSNQDATGVQWRCRLPGALLFVEQEAGIVYSDGVVNGGPVLVSANSTLAFSFTVAPTANATYRLASQITVADNPDPEATPDFGTNSGQKYVAWADFRTTGATANVVFSSPEPNPAILPPVASNQPVVAAGFSDLSLGIQTSTLTPVLNGEVTVTVRIASRGYYFDEQAQVRCQLPPGISFVSSSDFTASGAILTSVTRSVYTYEPTALTFRARVNQPGQTTLQAEIVSAGRPDPDSTPNNGYDTGEDDTAQISLRTIMQ